MKPNEVHVRIARLVVDGTLADAAGWAKDPARLSAAIAAQLAAQMQLVPAEALQAQGTPPPQRPNAPSNAHAGWAGAVATSVADRLSASGMAIGLAGVQRGHA